MDPISTAPSPKIQTVRTLPHLSVEDLVCVIGFSLKNVAKVALQLFKALCELKKIQSVDLKSESAGLIHTDIKPENILLVSSQGMRIKLSDFGCGVWCSKVKPNTYAQSRHYRSPEVALGFPIQTASEYFIPTPPPTKI